MDTNKSSNVAGKYATRTSKCFDFKAFDECDNTYIAIENTISLIRETANVQSYTQAKYKTEFLFNTEFKSAILLKSVARASKPFFNKKRMRSKRVSFDIANRIIPTRSGYIAVTGFFKEEKFKDYELIVPCGNYSHETCLFFRMLPEGGFDVIFYNPNYSDIQDGVQLNRVTILLMNHFGNALRRIRAYHAPNGNENSQCSALTWQEMFNDICQGASPFTNSTIELVNFDYKMMEHKYKAYHSSEKNESWKNIDTWLECDELLADASARDVLDISQKISTMIVRRITPNNLS